MAEFMNGKLKFGELSRGQRIGCTKVREGRRRGRRSLLQGLRNLMETRMSALLSSELDKSLAQIQDNQEVEA